MRYKLIILDIDGTIVRHISSWQYIHERLGIWDDAAEKYQNKFLKGRISYKKFCELDATCWKGISERRIEALFKKVPYTKNAAACIKKLKAMRFKLAAVSTGLQYIPARIKKELGFDYIVSNSLISEKGVLTGGVKINVGYGSKAKSVKRILKAAHIKPSETITVGDTEGDIPMLSLAGYSIAFNSSSEKLSRASDYACKTKDFREVFCKIIELQKL